MNLFDHNISEIKISYHYKLKASDRPKITCSRDADKIIHNHVVAKDYQLEHREYFFLMLLNRANKVLGLSLISMGGTAGTVADPKIIFQTALKASASSLVLIHNHPSGNLQPSESDIRLTKKLKNAGSFLDLPVIDHLIVTEDSGYFSFADEGLL